MQRGGKRKYFLPVRAAGTSFPEKEIYR